MSEFRITLKPYYIMNFDIYIKIKLLENNEFNHIIISNKLVVCFYVLAAGSTSSNEFLRKFFPSVYIKMKCEMDDEDGYCRFDSQMLTLFTSSIYMAAMVAPFFASSVTTAYGRKTSMILGGLVFFVGSFLGSAAMNIEMLIIGRLLLGVGVGFGNQVLIDKLLTIPKKLNC